VPPNDHDDRTLVRTIRDVVDGRWIKVVGRVVAYEGASLTAPITGRGCVCFDAAVWSHERVPGDGVDDWLTHDLAGVIDIELPRKRQLLARSLRGAPFVIEDATGRAVVDPRGAFVRLTHDFKHGGPDDDGRTLAVVDRTFLDGVELRGHIEYWEGVLELGETVVVSGVVTMPAAATGRGELYRGSGDQRVRISGSAESPGDVTDLRAEIDRAGGDPARTAQEMSPGTRVRQHVSGRKIIAPQD
jgi:hypothetical protein